MLALPNVTLLFVETRAHEITRRVIEDARRRVNFAETVVYTDNQDKIGLDGIRYVPCIDFPNKREAGRFYYSAAMREVKSDFALMLEWDGGIYDETMWQPEFLNYDYVGAPWPRVDNLRVGNGGFTLMSKRLGQHVCNEAGAFQITTDMEFCRTNRPRLEGFGFKWAPFELAHDFSWELINPRSPKTFGFHGAFNWPDMLSRQEIIARAGIMFANPYLLTKVGDLVRRAPWLAAHIDPEHWQKFLPSLTRSPRPFGAHQTLRQAVYAMQSRKGQTA